MKFLYLIIVTIGLISLSACQSEEGTFSWFSSESGSHTCGLTLQSARPSFSDEVISTRLSDGNWEEGDQVYIRFSSSSYGVGTYTNGDWDFSYNGKLSNISEATCAVYFLKGDNVIVNNATISFDPKTAIYCTTTAFYSYSSSSNWLTVGGTLSPMTSRIRFSGATGTDFDLQHGSGLVFYNQLNVSDNTFSQQTGTLHETIHEDGYSDYLYLSLDSDTELSLNVDDVNFSGKKILKSQLSNGVSGVISLPTKSNHNGWTMAKKQLEDKYTIGNTDYSSGWWAAFSKSYVIPDGDEWHAHFNLHINPQATTIYKNFGIIITNDANRSDYDYREYGAIRFDNLPTGYSEWGDYIDRNLVESTLTFNTDTDSGIEKLGGEIELTVDRSNNHFYVEITNGKVTKTYKQNNPLPNLNNDQNNTNIRVYLVPEGSYIDFISTDIVPLESLSDGAILIDGLSFNKAVKKLANGREMSEWDEDETIKEFRVECNSLNQSGLLVSPYWSKYPIYANFYNGILEISTQDNSIKVLDMCDMFSGLIGITKIDLSKFDTQDVSDMSYLFHYCHSLTNLDITSFDTRNVTDMGGMFFFCKSLTSLDLSHFDTSNVTNMFGMFTFCHTLKDLDITKFDTHNVYSMEQMFSSCGALTSLDLSNFDTHNVKQMRNMFANCYALTNLDLSHFETYQVSDMNSMFVNCSNLARLDISSFNTKNVYDMQTMFASCNKLSNLILGKSFVINNSTNIGGMFHGISSYSEYCTISCLSDVKKIIENNIENTGATFNWEILDSTKEVLDFESSYTWNGGIREGNVVTFYSDWDGLAWWMEYRTDIAKIVAEFEEPTTITTQFYVICPDSDGYRTQAPAGSMKLEIELPKCTVEQFAIQNEVPGTIKVKSVTIYSY